MGREFGGGSMKLIRKDPGSAHSFIHDCWRGGGGGRGAGAGGRGGAGAGAGAGAA